LRSFGFAEGTRIAVELGYKGNMSNVSAALVSFNLARLEGNLSMRSLVRDEMNSAFGLKRRGLGMYLVTVDDPDAVCAEIPAIRHYPRTLSEQVMGATFNMRASWLSQHLVSLPFHEYLVDNEVERVCAIVKPRLITYEESHGTQRPGAI
jgi:dTDP-4-amino-4,6-dideoxygalactose transaminase